MCNPLQFKSHEVEHIIIFQSPTNDRVSRDIERIKWFSRGHGGHPHNQGFTMVFEPEEYNCAIRYLKEFGYTQEVL